MTSGATFIHVVIVAPKAKLCSYAEDRPSSSRSLEHAPRVEHEFGSGIAAKNVISYYYANSMESIVPPVQLHGAAGGSTCTSHVDVLHYPPGMPRRFILLVHRATSPIANVRDQREILD